MNTMQQAGEAFLVDYLNSNLPEYQAERSDAYGQVQALNGHTLPQGVQVA